MNFESYIKDAKVAQIKKILPRRVLSAFTWKEILKHFGEVSMDVKKYEVDDQPDLYMQDVEHMTLTEFYKSDKRQWAIKHSFDRTTVNPFLQYLIKTVEEKVPLRFIESFTLRISPRVWSFPKHFDGVENFMMLLNGNREVDISYEDFEKSYSLRAGDVFYIPPMWEHFFHASNPEPPIVLNLAKRSELSDDAFKEAYPDRVVEIKKRV